MGESLEGVSRLIEQLLAKMSAAWAAHDFDYLRGLWSLSAEPLVYLPEEDGFKRSHAELQEYWRRTAAAIHEVRGNYTLQSVAPLSTTLYAATFKNEWAARERPGEEMIGGTCRGVLIVEDTADGIRPRVYVEAPMAPLLYIRELYELVARSRGLS